MLPWKKARALECERQFPISARCLYMFGNLRYMCVQRPTESGHQFFKDCRTGVSLYLHVSIATSVKWKQSHLSQHTAVRIKSAKQRRLLKM